MTEMEEDNMKRQLKPYMGFTITKYVSNDYTLWKAENENGYVYESKKSLKDLKERIYLDD